MIPVLFVLILSSALPEAKDALKQGDYETAIREYRLAVQKKPDSYEAQFGLARALALSGKRSEAIQIYSDLISQFPEDPDAHLGRGRCYAQEKQYDKAEKDLTFVTEKYPKYADAWSALGDVWLWSGHAYKAVKAYTQWIELAPDAPRPYLARAKAYRNTRQFQLARKDLHSAQLKGENKDEIQKLLRDLNQVRGALPWEASFNYSLRSFSSGRNDWHTYSSSIRRTFSRGSLALESIRTFRFSSWDEAVALDGYLDLWSKAYGNVRFQVTSDADVLPDRDYAIEVFQAFGEGWEVSGRYGHRDYSHNNIDMYGASLGKYAGKWYGRVRSSFLPEGGEIFKTHAFSIRRYFATADDFLECNAGRGEEMVNIGAGQRIRADRIHFFGVRFQKFMNPRIGFTLAANYEDEENLPVGREVSFGIITRW